MPSAPTAASRRRFRIFSRQAAKRLTILFLLACLALFLCYWFMLRMPGKSHSGTLPPGTSEQAKLASELRADVEALAGRIGGRSTFQPRGLAESALHISSELESAGYSVNEHTFVSRGTTVPNLEAVLKGTTRPDEIIVVGAHFDSYQGTPGADDNASGVAAVLALARRFARSPHDRTIRFVFFVNEEPPAFWTKDMGSWVYAKKCRADADHIVAMISLESIGYYDDNPGSQKYPPPLSLLYPDRGNFVAFVGNVSSRGLVRRAIATFRETTEFPSEGAALPWFLPGVGWSDQWSFWKEGYPGITVTGTATYRNPNYHTAGDTPQTLDYDRLARVIEGVSRVVDDLATAEQK